MKNHYNPKVSIIIPVYNGSNYLKESIESALAQTYKNIEILVINDGSNDNGQTEKIAKSYGKKVRYFKKTNGGVASALNLGIKYMTGVYFSWLSHDDLYSPQKIEKQIVAISNLEDKTTIIYSDYAFVDQNLNTLSVEDLSKMYSIEDLDKPLFSLLMGYINGLSLLVHRDNFKRYGVFNEKLLTTQDYDLWFRILKHSKIKYVPGVLTLTRIHTNQSSNTLKDEHRIEKILLWDKMFSTLTETEKISLSGSVLKFYRSFYTHFKKMGINEELQMNLYKQLFEEYINEYRKGVKEKSLKKIAKEIDCVDEKYVEKFLSFKENCTKTKILFWSDNWKYRGGLNRVIVAVAEQLSDYFDVYIGCWKDPNTTKGFPIPSGVNLLEIDQTKIQRRGLAKLFFILNIRLFICSQNFDKDYLMLYENFKSLGIKLIAWDHSHYFLVYYYRWLLETARIKNDIYKKIDLVVCVNNLSSRLYRTQGIRAITIKNPVSIKVKNKPQIEKHPRNIIAVGRFDDYQKRLDLLLQVFSKVLKKLPNTKLYVVGTYNLEAPYKIGASESFSQYINKLGIKKDNIVFTGHVDNVEEYYEEASVHVMTSEREGFGIVITEAASFGIPSVVFEGNGGDDIIANKQNGYLIPNNDLDLMSNRIVSLLSDGKILKNLSLNACEVTKDYAPNTIGEEWLEICKMILEMNNSDIDKYLNDHEKENKFNSNEITLINLYEDSLKFVLKEYSEKNLELDQKVIDMQLLNTKVARIEQELFNIKNSHSWKITLPIRKFSRLILLFKSQGIFLTVRNFILIIKNKIYE